MKYKSSTVEKEFELKTASGKVVTWSGNSGENAARRYVDCFRDETIVAWRDPNRHGIHIYEGEEIT